MTATKKRPAVLTLLEVRAIALRSQGLAENGAPFGVGKAGVLRAIQHLGYVQVDTVSVVERAHHHILWTRVPDYRPAMLHDLQSPGREVFEYWNHAASYLPMRDFRYSIPLMRKFRSQFHWSDDTPELRSSMRRMMRLIRKNGPLMLSDVESKGTAAGWTEEAFGKIERRALHELWMRGEIMICHRHGFQKVFDLPERVLPDGLDVHPPARREATEFHVRRALRALGVAGPGEMAYMQDAEQTKASRVALEGMVKSGEAVAVEAAEMPKVHLFAPREALDLKAPLARGAVRFLSPFDNLTIQRKRLKWLFDFDYTVEIYVPAAKRKYGYFVLPVLWGDEIIARADVKAMRAERRLVVLNLVFEPSFREWKEVKTPLAQALDSFTAFQGCDSWEVTRCQPAGRFRG